MHLICKMVFNAVYDKKTETFFQTWMDVTGEEIVIPYNAGDYKLARKFDIK